MDVEKYIAEKKAFRIHARKHAERFERAMKKEVVFFDALDDKYVQRISGFEAGWGPKWYLAINSQQDYFRRVLNIVLDHFDNPKGIWAKFDETTANMDFNGVLVAKKTGDKWEINITGPTDSTCHVSKEETVKEYKEARYKLDLMSDCI